ncbi:3-hydroxyacyl-CoA dehydrogenase family protein [Sporomusa aerivorans]|uniref:3-hydroxyacyl-CoA dehydrogenase family protein n=1 Tax=Sporomusa aerivorans TaxID=204936 RepID=UPI00352B8FE2
MKIDDIKKVVVIGGGTMGKQIALNAAIHGYEVNLTDSFPGVLEKVDTWSKEYLNGRVAKGKMAADVAQSTIARFHMVHDLAEAVKDAELVIEVIVEKLGVKQELFVKLETLTRPDTILVSNSSTFVPSVISSRMKNRSRVANLHYFNPALHMELVEVVAAPQSSKETIDTLMEFATRIGKNAIKVQKEIEGFVVNRLLGAINSEAWFLLENGYATVQEIDIAAEKGLGHPMGPFRIMDLAGLDVIYDIRNAKYKAGQAERPPKTLEEKVKNGHFGRKTGQGFYTYK